MEHENFQHLESVLTEGKFSPPGLTDNNGRKEMKGISKATTWGTKGKEKQKA